MRIFTLDYLRAILALGIMFAHYSLWACGPGDAYVFGTRLEIYSVPMFYLLSGITIHCSSSAKMKLSYDDIKAFFSNRLLRLAPLYFLATCLTLILFRNIPDVTTIFTNITGLFSVYNWDQVIVYGGWSLGNELVFYSAFPILLWLSRTSLPKYILTLSILFAIYVYFAFYKLDHTKLFIDQWKTYVHPLNQLFLFGVGTAISSKLRSVRLSPYLALSMIILGLLIIYQYPVSGDRIQLVTGTCRIVFTGACGLIMIGLFKTDFKLPENLHQGIMLITKSSYGIYLFHPIIYRVIFKLSYTLLKYGVSIPTPLLYITSALTTLVISYLAYSKFQVLFIGSKKENKLTQALS